MASGLLLLHGFTGSPASWNAVVRTLSTPVRTLAPTLVGHGHQMYPSVSSFEDEVDRIASLVTDTTDWHVAGYSLGARVALGLLVRHAGSFEGATLIGGQPGLESESARADRRAHDERWRDMLRNRPLSDFVSAWQEQPLFRSQRSLSDETLATQRAERLAQDPAGLVRSLEVTGLGVMPSYWDALDDVRVPTTLVAGSRDEKFAAIAREMTARMPVSRLEIVPEVGHNVVLEAPAAVGALIERALARTVES
jgi:2-succinyl-6-hydroxy-2,4-cyclohexadiene-1-carboxylate synthase